MRFQELNSVQKITIIVLTILKISFALLIFYNPIWGILLSLFFDWIDGGIFILLGMKIDREEYFKIYHNFDKVTDFIFDLVLITYLYFTSQPQILLIAIVLLSIRFMGIFIYYQTQNTKSLLIFPNIFENFALLYIITTIWGIPLNTFFLLTIAIITKMPQEYFLHKNGNRDVAKWTVTLYEKVLNI